MACTELRTPCGLAHGAGIASRRFVCWTQDAAVSDYSGGFRNLERGVQPLVRETHLKIFGLPRLLLVIATDW